MVVEAVGCELVDEFVFIPTVPALEQLEAED